MGVDWKVPDYKKYKVELIPELRDYERRLALTGLKDPWIRNYVWRYMNPWTDNGNMTRGRRMLRIPMIQGMVAGAVFVASWIGIDQTLRLTGVIEDKGHH